MKIIHRALMAVVLGFFLTGLPSALPAQTPPKESSPEIVALLKEQNKRLSDDLRRIQREIAALRADFDKPDVKDVLAGIGYIFGLFGVAAFVASRRKGQ